MSDLESLQSALKNLHKKRRDVVDNIRKRKEDERKAK